MKGKIIPKIAVSLLPLVSANAHAAEKKPNIVLILADDLGWSDFGCYGSEIQTPTIDSLALHGLRYRQFHNTPRSSPTRCAILTGLYTQQVAVDPGASLPPLRTDNNVTIAELLGSNGYNTYMAGKWHLGNLSSARDPISRGFQHAFGVGPNADGANLNNYWNISQFGLKSQNNEIPWNPYTGQQFYMTDATGDYASTFIKHNQSKKDGKPFFLYVAFNAGHFPINAPADITNKYTDVADPNPLDKDIYNYEVGWDSTRTYRFERQKKLGVINANYKLSPRSDAISPANTPIPAWNTVDLKRRNDLARRMALYAAMIHQLDVNVKKVVDALKETNQLDSTLIFIVSDNGGNWEGGLWGNPNARDSADLITMGQPNDPSSFPIVNIGSGWGNVANTPFRLFKHFAHEGGIRSPGIIYYPAGIKKPGTWVEQNCHLIDIMATVVEVTGVTYPTTFKSHPVLPLEGKSLVPHFTGGQIAERQIFEEHESNRALYDGDYKFVTKNFDLSDGSSPANTFELYNIIADPSELNNLAQQQPDRLMTMIKAWNKKAKEVGVPTDRLIALDTIQNSLQLKFHFSFDDNIKDSSPSAYSLTPSTNYTPVYAAGKFGKAISLNGISDYLDLTQTGILNPALSTFTVCAWVYNTTPDSKIPTTTPLEQQIMHQLDGRIMLNGELSSTMSTLGTWQGGSLYTANPTVFVRNQWQHVAIVSNPGTKTHTFYVNGHVAGVVTNTGTFESKTGGFRIGAHKSGASSFWNGQIDELYLFAGTLDSIQVNKVMNNDTAGLLNTSTKEMVANNKLSLYPNPTSGVVNFGQQVDRATVLSLNGAMLMQSYDCSKMDISILPAGQYIIRSIVNNEVFINTIINTPHK